MTTNYTIAILTPSMWKQYHSDIMRLEEEVYEPARRESSEILERLATDPLGLSFLATVDEQIAGFCFAGPLEWFANVKGVTSDAEWHHNNTLYSADVTVASHFRGMGLGRLLKLHQVGEARRRGYRFIAGRNRLVIADAMIRVNVSLGAEIVCYIRDTYRDGITPDACMYYHIDLGQSDV
jgi:GNAT superfamily N-acetyltransferase